MHRSISFVAWTIAILALITWVGVGWFALTLQSMQAQYVSGTEQSANSSSKNAQALNLHTAITQSTSARSQLVPLITVDPTTLAAAINQVSTTADVTLQIQNATPETVPANAPTQAFDFSITGQGSFDGMVYALELLEALPPPASIQSFQLIPTLQNATPQNSPWQLTATVRFVTATTNAS